MAALLRRALPAVVLLGVLAALAASSTWTVAQTEQGVVLRFGRVTRVVPPGIHFTWPWPVERLVTVPTSEVIRMPVGYRLAAAGLPSLDDEVQWLTGDTNIVELKATVYFTRSDPVTHLFGMSDMRRATSGETTAATETGDVPRVFAIRKAAEAVLTELIAAMPIDEVLSTGKVRLQQQALPRVQALLEQLRAGVTVTAVDIVEVNPPRDVNSAFQDVASAKADRERRITEATGERNQTLPRTRAEADKRVHAAEIYRSEVVARARGAAERFRKVEAEIRKNRDLGMLRLWLDLVRDVLPQLEIKVVEPGQHTRIYVQE